MKPRTNYRVKLDLSKFYHDARRFSWIYVNSTNIWFISHLKRHIKDVFDIAEPFHLLLNGNEYLPPAEDVRVLEENEIIVVERGSGLGKGDADGANASSVSLPASDTENAFATDTTDPRPGNGRPLDEDRIRRASVANGVVADTGVDPVVACDAAYARSPSEDTGVLEANDAPPRRRKRIRRKKLKRTETEARRTTPLFGDTRFVSRVQPRIAFPPPSGTHIRFDGTTNVGASENGKSVTGEIRSASSEGPAAGGSLAKLLALGDRSSPLAFTGKRPKYESAPEQRSNEKEAAAAAGDPTKAHDSPESGSSIGAGRDGGLGDPNDGGRLDEYADLKPNELPCLESSAEIGDVVAFKVLRMGREYTPEVSDYIVAETLARCPDNLAYTFKIIKGQSEIEGPSGKFSLPEEDAATLRDTDTLDFPFSQLIEPRLVRRAHVSR